MPYRRDEDALLERLSALQHADDDLRRRERELSSVAKDRARLEAELADVRRRLGESGRRALPLLDRLEVAAPCSASWDDMVGDEVTRFCGACEKDVHNLSAMTRDEAEAFLRARAGDDVCVRFYRRRDGTVMSADCPVGVRWRRRRRVVSAMAGVGALGAAAASVLYVPVARGGGLVGESLEPVQGGAVVEVGQLSGERSSGPPRGIEQPAPAPPQVEEGQRAGPTRGAVMGRLRAAPQHAPPRRGVSPVAPKPRPPR